MGMFLPRGVMAAGLQEEVYEEVSVGVVDQQLPRRGSWPSRT